MLRYAIAIFLVTAAVRGFLLMRISPEDFLYGVRTADGYKSGDESINVAVSLNQTGRFANPFPLATGDTAHVPPIFPLIIAPVFRVAGDGMIAAAIRNAITIAGFGLLYASFPFATRALSLGATPGCIAGFLASIFPTFRSTEVFRSRDEWLTALLLLWLTILVCRMCSHQEIRLRDTLGFGCGWGLVLLSQPSTVPLFFVQLFVLQAFRKPIPRARRILQASAALVIVTLILIPWTIRNHRSLGAWMFVRDNLGLELRLANGDGAQASQEINQRTGWYCTIHPICSHTAIEQIRTLGEAGFNRECLRTARAWIHAHYVRFSILTVERSIAFWTDLPNQPATFLARLLWSVLGWIGVVQLWKSGNRLQGGLFASALAIYPLVYYVLEYSDRYVVPICFAVFLPAGFVLHHIYIGLRTAPAPPASM